MFLENSRYFNASTVETTTREGRQVTALKLRALPTVAGDLHEVKENDQLDVLAHQQYDDGTKFWKIADANTALQAGDLVSVVGDTFLQPKN